MRPNCSFRSSSLTKNSGKFNPLFLTLGSWQRIAGSVVIFFEPTVGLILVADGDQGFTGAEVEGAVCDGGVERPLLATCWNRSPTLTTRTSPNSQVMERCLPSETGEAVKPFLGKRSLQRMIPFLDIFLCDFMVMEEGMIAGVENANWESSRLMAL